MTKNAATVNMGMRRAHVLHSSELHRATRDLREFHAQVEQVVNVLTKAFAAGGKVLIAGNGGSAAEAQHLSDELVGRYRADRRPFPAIALTADSMVLTCIGNDYGYEHVFRRQVEALGSHGDVFIGLTTSGTSRNILIAAEQARAIGMTVIAFTGMAGSFGRFADIAVVSPSGKAAIVQELHLHAIHLICESLEPPSVKGRGREKQAKANGREIKTKQ
jgi:D-sedoheptulose 7-phosphate isomerase